MRKRTKVDFKFDLGIEVEHTITGYKGIIISRSQWLSNCNTYGVKSRELKDGKPIPAEWFDEPELKEVQNTKKAKEKRDTGGLTPRVKMTNR